MIDFNLCKDDQLLLALQQKKDALAFCALVKKYNAQMYSYCYRLTKDADSAEDLLQETYMKAFISINTFKRDCPFLGWMYVIAKNRFITDFRSKKLTLVSLDDVVDIKAAHSYDADAALLKAELKGILLTVIETLNQPMQDILKLHFIDELSNKEIAATLNMSDSNVRSKIHRGYIAVRTKIGKTAA